MERKLKRFNILLDDESLLYFPGSFLTGKVLLELEENTPATGLYFHIIGEGVVKLTDDKKKTKKGQKGVTSDRENYIDFRMRLLGDEPEGQTGEKRLGGGDGSDRDSCISNSDDLSLTKTSISSENDDDDDDDDDDEGRVRSHHNKRRNKILVLSPGVHTFPFKLGLPPNLPSTFLSEQGFVQYYCRSVLKEPSGLIHKNQQVFIIINPIDLNQEPANLQQPFYCEAEEKVKSRNCIASSGLISCRVRLDRGGYVPGENILISASIENSSTIGIKKTRAFLAETVEYRAKNKVIQTETRELSCVERGKIGPKSTDVWKKEILHIPALPPTNLRGCHLIKIHYDVYFQIITKNNTKKPIELQLPIVMATYPVRNKDGTLKRRKGASYPDSLPILRPWMSDTMKH
uniref:Arrestin domain-containing protein 2 n=1 Tax=Aceria tosichella TaxID=561515 RepID=A0A6G1SNW3_9ACAR